jgi:hypothetical protein
MTSRFIWNAPEVTATYSKNKSQQCDPPNGYPRHASCLGSFLARQESRHGQPSVIADVRRRNIFRLVGHLKNVRFTRIILPLDPFDDPVSVTRCHCAFQCGDAAVPFFAIGHPPFPLFCFRPCCHDLREVSVSELDGLDYYWFLSVFHK